jgi:hypothetical protein
MSQSECACDCAEGRCICRRCGRSYAAPKNRVRALCQVRPLPGTELKALLKTIGIVASPTCSCNKRAKVMDEKGCDWCEANIDTISDWLAEEAKKRKLPYLSLAGKTLIRLAIRRARKKGNSR